MPESTESIGFLACFTQELAISLLLKWKAEQEAEGENPGGGL